MRLPASFPLVAAFGLAAFQPLNLPAQPGTGMAAIRVATGLSQPLAMLAPPGDTNRLFIVEQTGRVKILNLATGALNPTPFLDLSGVIQQGGEAGLLGMAFDPNYATNGKFYLYFIVPGGAFGLGVTHVSQFAVSAGNPDIADTSVEKLLLSFDQPQSNHNGGWIGFSPRPGDENNLYIASGDGGSGNDQGNGHIEPGGNAQNTTTPLGKMLRIHVDSLAGTASIPADNPFFGSSTNHQAIWAYGLRNPFRCSFDRASGRLFIGDVGQNAVEEVDVQHPSNPGGGENYGWRLREGTIATPGAVGGARPPGAIDPILDYSHGVGGTVIGGYVYRGRQLPNLRGTYIFGDFVVGKVFSFDYDGVSPTATNFQDITSRMFPTTSGSFNLANPASFGEDANGELYIADIGAGSVFKIIPAVPNIVVGSTAQIGNGTVRISGFGVPFQTHTVQASPDLAAPMADIGTVVAAGDGSFSFDDPNAGSFSERYYRVVLP